MAYLPSPACAPVCHQCAHAGCVRRPALRSDRRRLCTEHLDEYNQQKKRAKGEASYDAPMSALEQIGSNAVSLLHSLPAHSHHRAPLLHHLAQGITSTTAAATFHSSASYVRECKRKNCDDSDLLVEKYSRDVSRQKLPVEVLLRVINYIKENCPTKSGAPRVEYRQYVNDAELFSGYLSSPKGGIGVVSLNTFLKYKRELGVKRVRSYWGQFDCAKCLALRKLKPQWSSITHESQLNSLRLSQPKGVVRDLLYHRVQYFPSSINTELVEITSNVDIC